MKKLNWLDKFAEEQAKKMNKVASTTRVAEQVIVSPEDVPGAQDGQPVEFNGEHFTVVNANFEDEMGKGVVLEKSAAASDGSYQGLENDPMGLKMGEPASAVSTPSSNPGQTYFRTKLPIQEMYNNDQDAAWGQESAGATAQEIATEDSTDRTTVPGHYTKSPGLGGGAAGMGAANNLNPQTPGIVTDGTQPEGEFGSQTITDIQEQSNFFPASPGQESAAPVAPPAAPTPAAPVADASQAAPAVPAEEEKPEDASAEEVPVEEKEEDKKLASNRILNRIYQKASK